MTLQNQKSGRHQWRIGRRVVQYRAIRNVKEEQCLETPSREYVLFFADTTQTKSEFTTTNFNFTLISNPHIGLFQARPTHAHSTSQEFGTNCWCIERIPQNLWAKLTFFDTSQICFLLWVLSFKILEKRFTSAVRRRGCVGWKWTPLNVLLVLRMSTGSSLSSGLYLHI